MLFRVNNQAELNALLKGGLPDNDYRTIVLAPGNYLYLEDPDTVERYQLCLHAEKPGVYLEVHASKGDYTVDNMKADFFGCCTVYVCGGEVGVYNECRAYAYGGKIKAGPNVIVEVTQHVTPEITGGVIYRRETMWAGLPVEEWMKHYGLEMNEDGTLTVYKGVDNEYFSQHGWKYTPGSTPFAPDWRPKAACGGGLHFSPRPHLTKLYCYPKRYMACRILPGEAVTLGDKIKACRVMPPGCVEVDISGKPAEGPLDA